MYIKIGVTSDFAHVELRITQSIFATPLDFEIARLTCIYRNQTLSKQAKKCDNSTG